MFLYTGRIHSHVDSPSCKRHVHGHVHCTRAGTASTRTAHGRLSLYTARTRPADGRALMYTCTRPLHGLVLTVYTAEKGRVHGRLHGPYTAVYACRVHGLYTAVYVFVYTGLIHSRIHGPSCIRPVVYTARTRRCTRADTARTWPCTRARSRPCRCTRVYVYTSRIHGPCARPVDGPSFTWHVHGR